MVASGRKQPLVNGRFRPQADTREGILSARGYPFTTGGDLSINSRQANATLALINIITI